MIINSAKSLFTYTNRETLSLVHIPSSNEVNLYTDYHNFINSVLIIYGDQKIDGTIPVFWTRVKNNETLEREADPNSTLKELEYNKNYYVEVIVDKLPIKIPQPLDSNQFLNIDNLSTKISPCFDNLCDSRISIPYDNYRNISLTSETGHVTNIHIPISGLLPNKNYTFTIDPIHSNWPNKLTKASGTILRNSPLDSYGTIKSSIDTKFLYLYRDGIDNFNNSLPYSGIDTSNPNHSKNIFSIFSLKIYDENNSLKLIDTINILCNTCIPTPTFIPSPTPTPSSSRSSTPTPTPTIGTSPTPPSTQQVTPTPTLTPTQNELLRRCPYINIRNKNIILNDKNYAEINADFYYLNPNIQQAYEFICNEATWPTLISNRKEPIVNYNTYYENGIQYASGTIDSILYFNNNINSHNNLSFNIPFYKNENFFNKNKFINLKLKIGTYTTDLGFNINLEEDGRCSVSSDLINVLCSGCVSDTNGKNCIESINVRINDSNLDYPILSSTSNPSAELLIDEDCCNKNNTLFADISGLCPNNTYSYTWSSFPEININPKSGLLATNNNFTKLNTVYNLNYNSTFNQISNIKLKITDLNTNKFVEDYILLRCNNGCYAPAITPAITPTPSATPFTPSLSFNDYIFIFIDESNHGYASYDNTPGPLWNLDLITFNNLNDNKYIDINKIIIFHVRTDNGSRQSIFPFVKNNTYGLPIPLNRIIDTPRNIPSQLVNNEALTGEWIYNKVNNLVGSIGATSRVNLFIDNSGSMDLRSISTGIQGYETILALNNTKYKRIICGTERWLRWITNIYNGSEICS